MATPKELDKLYAYWNELIKVVSFYLPNKDAVDDNLNLIYFELIKKIEDIIDQKQCGSLIKEYKRPFQSVLGCELEAKKNNKSNDDILSDLYSFLGKITSICMPEKNEVEKIKKADDLFDRIDEYVKIHSIKTSSSLDNIPQTQTVVKMELVGSPEIQIKGLEKGMQALSNTKEKNKHKCPYELPSGTR